MSAWRPAEGPGRLSPLNVILDEAAARAAGWSVPELARVCLEHGARFVQVRAKGLSAGEYLRLCDRVLDLARVHQALVIVNDRADVAALCGAAGVHVGQEDMSVADVRAVGAGFVVGLSTHTVDQFREGLGDSADYLAVGPVFGTRTKETGHVPVGLTLVAQVVSLARASVATGERSVEPPVVAIGGITLDRAQAVLDAGATAVAVIGDLLATGDPGRRVSEYLDRLHR